MCLILLAGLTAMIVLFINDVPETKLLAPMTQPEGITVPYKIVLLHPIHILLPNNIGLSSLLKLPQSSKIK